MNEQQLTQALRDNPDLAKLNEPAQPQKKSRVFVPQGHTLTLGAYFKSQTECHSFYYLRDTFSPVRLIYEPITLHLPGGLYKPDWEMVLPNGRIYMIEVKPARWKKAHGSSRGAARAIKEAALHFSEHERWNWWLLLKDKDGFTVEILKEVAY